MLPIGLIISLVLFYLLVFSGIHFFPGEFLIILTIVMVVVAVVRILFWRSRKKFLSRNISCLTKENRDTLWNQIYKSETEVVLIDIKS